MQVIEPDVRNLLRREREDRERGEIVEGQGPDQLGHRLAVFLVQANGARVAAVLGLQPTGEPT